MRNMICSLTVLALLASCDNQEATKRAEQSAQIAIALAAHEDLRLDFVPTGDGERDKLALADYRHEQRIRKGGLIDSLTAVSRIGSNGEQYAVGTMLADAHSSTAHFLAGKAMRQWAELADRSTLLVTHLAKIDQVNGSIQLFDRSEADLQSKLRSERTTLGGQISQYRSAVDDVDARIATEQKSLDSHDVERRMKEAEATEHQSRIKDASGTQLLDLSQKAAETRLAAVRAESRLKQQKLNIRLLRSEWRVSSRKLELVQELHDAINAQIEQVAQRQQGMSDALAEKQVERQELYRELNTLFSEVMAAYTQDVEKPLIAALEHASTAVDIAARVGPKSPRDSRQQAELNLIAIKVAKAHIQTQQVITTASFGHTLRAVADGVHRLLERADEADRDQYATDIYRNQANEFTERHAKLVTEANELIVAGSAESQELAGGGESAAATFSGLFAAYAKRIDDTLVGQASETSLPLSASGASAQTPPAAASPTASSDGRGSTTIDTITGDLPAPPDEAITADVTSLVWIDGRRLTPALLQETARMLLADNAGVVQGPLEQYRNLYGQFASAGGTSLLVSIRTTPGAEGPPYAPTVFVSLKPDVDETVIGDMFRALAKSNPMSPQVTTERRGDWLMIRPADAQTGPAGAPERRAVFERVLAAGADAPIRYAVVPNDSMQQQMAANAAMAGPQIGSDIATHLEGVQWFVAGIRFAGDFGVYTTVEFADEAAAAAAAQALNDQFDRQLAAGEITGPMAIFAPMIRSALQVNQQGSSMQINLSGPALRGIVAMAVPMLSQMTSGDPGAPPMPPGMPPQTDPSGEPVYTK